MQPTAKPVLQEPIGLLIEPHDTLFFRDGRPFGPTDTAHSQLPLPQTVAGMLRTCLMNLLGLDPSQIHRLRENTNGISPHQRTLAFIACRGPWLVKMKNANEIEDLFVPAPAHLCRLDKDRKRLVLLRPLKDELPGWRSPQPERQKDLRPLVYTRGTESVEPESRWLGKYAIVSVLRNEHLNPSHLMESEKLFVWEERTGVTISPETSTSEGGFLYSTRQLRLKPDIAMYVEIGWETVDDTYQDRLGEIRAAFEREVGWNHLFPESGVLLPFGGEGRRVSVKKIKIPFVWPEAQPDSKSENIQHAFTWLISPLINYQHARTKGHRKPWEPMSIGKLVAASCSKPLAVSGWDMAGDEHNNRRNWPRPTRYAVPAGTVYFWERGGNADQSSEWLPGSLLQLAENAKDRANGWGMALKGVW